MKKKKISTEEKKARKKITQAEWRKNNSDYDKNHPLTEEQKAKYKATRILKRANRTPEEVEKDRVYGRKRIYTEDQEARNKIWQAEYYQENKAKIKKQTNDWYYDNLDRCKEVSKEWYKANPLFSAKYSHKHDLGYWVVYLIHNFDGLNNIYCGMTQNIYRRMQDHKCKGKLNTDNYEIIKQLETLEDALEFEAYMHEQGYHGKITGRYK